MSGFKIVNTQSYFFFANWHKKSGWKCKDISFFGWQAQAKNVIKVNYVTNVIMVEEEGKKVLLYNINKIYILFILYNRVVTATFFQLMTFVT